MQPAEAAVRVRKRFVPRRKSRSRASTTNASRHFAEELDEAVLVSQLDANSQDLKFNVVLHRYQERRMQTVRRTLLFTLAFIFLTVPLVSNAQSPLQFIPVKP